MVVYNSNMMIFDYIVENNSLKDIISGRNVSFEEMWQILYFKEFVDLYSY